MEGGGKAIASSKNGVFGKIVNEYGPKNKTGVQPKSTTVLVPVQEKNNDTTEQDVQEGDIPKKGTKTWKITQFMFKQFCNISLLHMNVTLFAGKWDFSEQSDLLMVFKSMLLGGLKKDNYKELAKRLNEIGWNRSNDQCRHEVINSSCIFNPLQTNTPSQSEGFLFQALFIIYSR